MKHLIVIRHGRKEGELIAADQIAEIKKHGIPGLNELIAKRMVILHLGSALKRTRQTIKAFEHFIDENNLCRCRAYITADPRFGSSEMFAEFSSNKDLEAEAKNTTWYQAFEKYDPEFIKKTQQDMISSLKSAFNTALDGEIIIMVSHTPLVEWLAYAIDINEYLPRDIKLAELTGFIFNENKGEISFADTIGFEF